MIIVQACLGDIDCCMGGQASETGCSFPMTDAGLCEQRCGGRWLTSYFTGFVLESNGHVHDITDRTVFLAYVFYTNAIYHELIRDYHAG
jgi:hypothetical protein